MAKKTDSAEDFHIVKDIGNWPSFPILHLKKSCNDSFEFKESFGFLVSQNGVVLPSVFIPGENGEVKKVIEYSSVEEILLYWDVIK